MQFGKKEKIVVGIILIFIGLFMLTKQTHIYTGSWGYRGFPQTYGILIVLIILSSIMYIALRKKWIMYAAIASSVGLLISMLMTIRPSFRGSMLDLILVFVPTVLGAGTIIRALIVDEE